MEIKIDKFYLLNLDRSKERYLRMKSLLDEINLPVKYSRFSAVDGLKTQLVNRNTKQVIIGSQLKSNTSLIKGDFDIICADNFNGGFDPVKIESVYFNSRVPGEIGCACSHRKIWQSVIDNKYNNVLIMEDDLVFAPNFKSKLMEALQYVPDDFDLIYLGVRDWRSGVYGDSKFTSELLNLITKYYRKTYGNVTHTQSYIISNKGAKKLLDGTKTYNAFIDVKISDLIKNGSIIAYIIKPKLVNTIKLESDIGVFLPDREFHFDKIN